jgi:hypothetical protein
MVNYSAAPAAALERSDDGLHPGVYSYPTEIKFMVKTNRRFAPAIIVKILAQPVLDEPDIVFVDGDPARIMVYNFPQSSKKEFDEKFCASSSSDKLSCKFEIRSSRNSFHAIKIGVWDILKDSQVWLKNPPGRFTRLPSPPSAS